MLSQLVIFWEILSPLQLALLQSLILRRCFGPRALEKGILMIFGSLNMGIQRQIQECWLDIVCEKEGSALGFLVGSWRCLCPGTLLESVWESNHDGCRDDSHDHLSLLVIPVIFTGPSYCFPGILIFFFFSVLKFKDSVLRFQGRDHVLCFFSHPLQRFVRRKPLLSAW